MTVESAEIRQYTTYSFGERGEYEMDLACFQLRLDGVELLLEPRVFDVLAFLIEHRSRTVPGKELLTRFWPPFITKTVLSRYISIARRCTGDDIQRQQVIRTVRGRGYQFVAQVTEYATPIQPRAMHGGGSSGRGALYSVAGASSAVAASAFVGRNAELHVLDSLLSRCMNGSAGIALISGEPGIGMSHLLSVFTSRASAQGARVLNVRCKVKSPTPAFWPWPSLIRSALMDIAIFKAGYGRVAQRELSRLLPELRGKLASYPLTSMRSDFSLSTLYDAVAWLLRTASEGRPLVLVIDELHAADSASLALLTAVASQLSDAKVLLVAAYREREMKRSRVGRAMIDALSRHASCASIALGGLTREEVSDVIELSSQNRAGSAAAVEIHQLTGGNPRAVHELVASLGSGGLSLSALKAMRPPPSMDCAVHEQTARLSPEARLTLRTLAIIRRPAHSSLLGEVLETSRADALARLDEAVGVGLVKETVVGSGSYELSHSYLRPILEDTLPQAEKVRLHRTIAEVLRRRPLPHPDDIHEIAHHLAQARW